MTDTTTTTLMPMTADAASRYQRLRSHLAALKLHAAAEALPSVLDEAAVQQLSITTALACAAVQSGGHPGSDSVGEQSAGEIVSDFMEDSGGVQQRPRRWWDRPGRTRRQAGRCPRGR